MGYFGPCTEPDGGATADIERHITIVAPPHAIRAFVLDAEIATSWQGSLAEYEQLSTGPVELGSRARGVSELVGMRLEWTAEVVEWTNDSWAWRSIVGDPSWEIRWTLTASDQGTDVTFEQSSPSLEGMKGAIARVLVGGQAERDLDALRQGVAGA